jgi:hypothetical protein
VTIVDRVHYVFSAKKEQVPMSDNRRVYRTIISSLRQLYPKGAKGNAIRHLNTLAALITGIVQSKNCQLPAIARKVPVPAKAESRIKQFSRWIQNEHIDQASYYLPFVQELLHFLAAHGELTFVIDGSEVGHQCIALMVSLIYKKRALPITWLVVKGAKGHLPERLHLELLAQLKLVLPESCSCTLLGDGEFDGIGLLEALQLSGWRYVCRTAKNTQVFEPGTQFSLSDLPILPDDQLVIPEVWFTLAGYGPVTVMAIWEKAYQEPLYLVTNFELADEAWYWYKKRFQIETFFGDQKSRGFHLHKSHLAEPQRLASLMIAACLAYLWMVFLGVTAMKSGTYQLLHRTDRCDWSIFRMGIAFLDHCLNQCLPLPVSFCLLMVKTVRC